MEKGQMVRVLRGTLGDCSRGGVSSKFDSFVLTGGGIGGVFEAKEDMPALRVVIRWAGTPNEYIHCEPVDKPEGSFPSFGGNYITGDSRVKDLCKYPIPVHDRFETSAEYSGRWETRSQ